MHNNVHKKWYYVIKGDQRNQRNERNGTGVRIGNVLYAIQEFARKHIGAIATIGLFGLFFMLITAGVSSCSAVINGGLSATMAGSYQSVSAQLDASDEAMTAREMTLQNTIDSIEEDYPDYDEYEYNLEEIGNNPFTLINYLSAIKVNVVAADVDAEIESLFDEMYELTLTPRVETRTRTVINEETGEEEEEEYEVSILGVELTRRDLCTRPCISLALLLSLP